MMFMIIRQTSIELKSACLKLFPWTYFILDLNGRAKVLNALCPLVSLT